MVGLRGPFNTDWYDIRNYVRPITVAFNQITGQFQLVRTELMFDGTAPNALEQLGSALHAYLTNPAERWFELQIEDNPDVMKDPDVLRWLEYVSDVIYSCYSREGATFNLAIHECFLDIGSFGTCNLYQEWSDENRNILFQAKPLQHSYFLENSKGFVDTVHFEIDWSMRQIKQEFGDVLPPKLMQQANAPQQDRTYRIVHCIYPRTDQLPRGVLPQQKPYASVWICETTGEVLRVSGYDTLPYHVARWTKLSGEIYGRSPAKKCLPDIKMLNAMEKTILKAGQKIVDPPLVLASEGFMLPIRTSPGALIFKEEEERKIEPLVTGANLPWAEDKAEQKRKFIQECFYADLIRRAQKKAEQTAYEVQDERDEMLRLMAPMIGRITCELLGPMIARSYYLLSQRGWIPDAPAIIQGTRLKCGYMGPAARAQQGQKANAISRVFQDMVPFAQVNPDVMDVFDFDKVAEEICRARGTPRGILRSPKDIAALREQKQKMQAASQAAQIAEPASNAIKNLASANKDGGIPAMPGL
jgi:hypothetical protein